MLAGVLSYVALIALVAATILSAGLAMTRMTIARMTQPYFTAGYQRAAAALQQEVAARMQSGGIRYPVPAFTPLSPACANASCTYTTGETIALTQPSPPTPGPACDASQIACAPNVQTNSYVGEGRVTATITVNVRNLQGSVVASRSFAVVLRTLSVPPYAAIAGSRDAGFDDVLNANAAGDDGGAPPATPNPCAAAAAGTADDTAVRVEYRNRQTAACTNGSTWGDASYGGTNQPQGWKP